MTSKQKMNKEALAARVLRIRHENSPLEKKDGLFSMEELKEQIKQGDFQLDQTFVELIPLQALLNELKNAHAYYLNTKLPEIEQSIHSLFQKQTDSNELLLLLCGFFISYQKKLVAHIQYEEVYLFPYVQAMLLFQMHGEPIDRERFGLFSLKQFHENHSDLEEDLVQVRQKISLIIDGMKTPLPFRIFMNQLEQFEKDLALHAILEDEILIPMMLRIEESILD